MNIANTAHLKLALLARGMRITEDAREGLGSLYQEKIYSYSLTDWIEEKVILPSDIRLSNSVLVGFRLNNDSEWMITKRSEKTVLERNGNFVTNIEFIRRPEYYQFTTTNGVPL